MRRSRAARERFSAAADPARIGPLLREAGFIGSQADPVAVRAIYDADGSARRVHARYADGWSCTLRRERSGAFSLSQCLRVRLRIDRRHVAD